jgi:Domain of unknown function (DUF4326)
MTKPIRVQLSRKKGWRMPANTVNVARPSKWGNPFVVGTHGTRAECVKAFAIMLQGWVSLGHGKDDDGKWHAGEAASHSYSRR